MITAVKPWVKTLSIALISGKYCLDSVLENYTKIKQLPSRLNQNKVMIVILESGKS